MYIRGYSTIAAPLNALIAFCTKTSQFTWTPKCQKAFNALIHAITTAPILQHPNFKHPFIVDTNALAYAIGTVLQQRDEKGKLHPVTFMSKTMDSSQCNWDIYAKELFAVVEALTHW